MYREVKMFMIACDGCGDILNPNDMVQAWKNREWADEVAKELLWWVDPESGRHYCPGCCEFDEETDGSKRRKPRQLELGFVYGVTREMACIMCHLSSECEGCCLKCDKPCAGQTCSQPTRDHEYNRFMTWMYLVNTSLPELKKFVPKKYLKMYDKQKKVKQKPIYTLWKSRKKPS